MEQKFEIFKGSISHRKSQKNKIFDPKTNFLRYKMDINDETIERNYSLSKHTQKGLAKKTFITTKNTTNVAHFPTRDLQAFR